MTVDPRSQSEFLFTLHIFKICTCTQLRYHWIERGNIQHVNSNHFKLCHKTIETLLVGICDMKVLLINIVIQNLVFSILH